MDEKTIADTIINIIGEDSGYDPEDIEEIVYTFDKMRAPVDVLLVFAADKGLFDNYFGRISSYLGTLKAANAIPADFKFQRGVSTRINTIEFIDSLKSDLYERVSKN